MRPRILLFSLIAAAEWPVLAAIEEWADVAVVSGAWLEDGGGAAAGEEQMRAHDWDTVVVVSDEWSAVKALEFLDQRPEAALGYAFGHACLELRGRGERPTLNPHVLATYEQVLQTDFRTWARAITQTTRGDLDDSVVERILTEISHEDVVAMFERLRAREGESFEPVLRAYGGPLLLAWHSECLLWTEEGFHDAAARFPDARTVEVTRKPSASLEFVEALRQFATDCHG